MDTNYTITKNDSFGSNELLFTTKPDEETRTALKGLGFRWNPKKGVWYGFASPEEVAAALGNDQIKASAPAINLDGLGENNPGYHSTDLAKAIREDLKRRGVSGCTVRGGRATYTATITVTVKATADDLASIEEMHERFTFSYFLGFADTWHGYFNGEKHVYNANEMSRDELLIDYDKFLKYNALHAKFSTSRTTDHRNHDYYYLTTAFYNKLCAIKKIADQWNYDHSDSMTDYFDVGYYLDIDIKLPDDCEIRESMTEEERTAYEEEQRKEAEEEAARLAQFRKEQEEREAERKAYEEKREKDLDLINNNITVFDLPADKQIYITNLAGGIGKECNLAELDESITDYGPHMTDAVITRCVDFATQEAFNTFCSYLLDDFAFLDGMGGTGTDDTRLEGVNPLTLNQRQRETVKFYMCNCVGLYVDGVLTLVSDPQGYTYSRYTYKLTDDSEVYNALEVAERQAAESKEKEPLYFPKPIKEQIEAIKPGDEITIYQCDGWILNSIYGGFGEVEKVEPGRYAQYEGFYITLRDKKKDKCVFVRDNHELLIYPGIMPLLPDTLTKRKISENTSEILNYDELFPLVIKYYNSLGVSPLVDTIQR